MFLKIFLFTVLHLYFFSRKGEKKKNYGSVYTPNFILFKIKFCFPFNEISELNTIFRTDNFIKENF